MNRELLSACGLYCGACYHYRAAFPEGDHPLGAVRRRGRLTEGFTCRGCRSEQHYAHHGCAQCEIRACADARELVHCGACRDLPCERLRAFRDDGRIHHLDVLENLALLSDLGPDRWLTAEERRWQCTSCGTPFSWYESGCARCGAPVAGYGPDPTGRAP